MAYTITGFPILERIVADGEILEPDTVKWMERWRGMNLDDAARYRFPELSGSTSVNLKIETTEVPAKSRGTFVTTNSATNPNMEIAYFNLLSILGWGHLCRPAARYELGPNASQRFRQLMQSTPIQNEDRRQNRDRILAAIASGNPLLGAIKAKKPDTVTELESIAESGGPRSSHPVIRAIQAGNPLPPVGERLDLGAGYAGEARLLAREYSVLMTMDSLFHQWDRYSGGNVTIRKDDAGNAHFYSSDNGGAGLFDGTSWVTRNLGRFSRYDRNLIDRLAGLRAFLAGTSGTFLGYQDRLAFLSDLGLYFGLEPQRYRDRLSRNLGLLAERVAAVQAASGARAFFD